MKWLLSSFFAVSAACLSFQGYASDSDSDDCCYHDGFPSDRNYCWISELNPWRLYLTGRIVLGRIVKSEDKLVPLTREQIVKLLDEPDNKEFLGTWISEFTTYIAEGRPPFSFSARPLQFEPGMSGIDADEACNALVSFMRRNSGDWKEQVVLTRDPSEIFETVERYYKENSLLEDGIDRFRERKSTFIPAAYTFYVVDGSEGCFKFTHGDGVEGITSWNFLKFPLPETKNLRRSRYFIGLPPQLSTVYWGARGAQTID
jgi:hypothetical protein